MLLKEDLQSTAKNELFKLFLEELRKNIPQVMKKFNDWYSLNRNQLKVLHAEEKIKQEFMEWARHKFYYWSFHQERKTLETEIKHLTGE